ncbi:MAG: flagellar hook-associated protein FlgK [Betaproteobacteria bacterium]|jgi:flagellar hook-associated protein 1 FlgK|nr:flagellar hook-associated protein FlgK [Burkholderiaceae bacterium]MCZ8112379.1 flagellar hook-associated protein FlgK [Rubrivivax sp.]MCZ8176154.1 flagellar hook-associated protein FlgK [Burkholderiaceae bacterium]
MSGSPLISLGMRAMAASYAGLQVTGHNIANASVEGYSRQKVVLTTPEGQFTGAGFFGRGVMVQSVTRAHDAMLTREAATARSLAAMDSARLTQLRRLEQVFQLGENGLGAATVELMDAFTDLANRPDDLSTRQVVLARARDLADRFTEVDDGLNAAQGGVAAAMRVSVQQINSLASGIAEANRRIVELKGLGQPANDVLDERDRLISRLAEQVQVTRMEASDGSMSVFIGGGQRLVLGREAVQLDLQQDAADPSRLAVALVESGTRRVLDEGLLSGGALAGLMRFQNDDLVDARARVGQLAASVGGAVNAQQVLGLNLQPPPGTVPSQPMFAIGGPQVLPNQGNQRSGPGAFIGSVSIGIDAPAQLQPSEYELQESTPGSGAWMLTRLRDGRQTAVADGDVVDGMRIAFGAPPPQPGDRFLLQPVSRAASGFEALLDDPLDIAAASPLTASASPANVGTAAVALLRITGTPLAADATATFNFVNDSGNYTWELRDGGGALIGSGAATWTPGSTLPPSGTDINGFSLRLTGVPRNGDVLSVAPTPAGAVAASNGNANALQALRDATITGGRTPIDAWSDTLADIGVRVQSGQTASTISQAVSQQAEAQRADKSDVNLDEEAAKLIQYQQSYQAAAKVLQVAQTVFQQLIDVAGR